MDFSTVQLVVMVEGYRFAGDVMVDRALEDAVEANRLVYPILFCYRHFIELTLKRLIAAFGNRVGIEADWKSHGLNILWPKYGRLIEAYGVPDPDETLSIVRQRVLEFSEIDPESFIHRYPFDRCGNWIPTRVRRVDLAKLKVQISELHTYFEGTYLLLADIPAEGL